MNKMKQIGFVLMVFATVFTACGQKDFVKTESGLEYKKVEEGSGEKPNDGEFVLINIAYYGPNGNKMYSSVDAGAPQPLNYVDSMFTNNGSLEEGFRLCGKGDSLVLKVNAKDLFEKSFRRSLPDTLDADSKITINMGIENILTAEAFKSYRIEQMQKAQEKAKVEAEEQLAKDIETIDTYLEENGIKAESTEEGLRYVITKEGEGANAEAGQKVSVNYVGRLLDGTLFDTSVEAIAKEEGTFTEGRPYAPYEFTLGRGGVIKGWDIGITRLNKGAKATLYIPSTLAYGPRQRSEVIKANSILMFDVELVDIKE